MNTSRVAIVAKTLLGKILSIIGYIGGVFSLILVIWSLADLTSDEDAILVLVVFLIFLALCVFFVIKGLQIKRRIRLFKQYVALISGQQMTSLENIAASTNQTVDFVSNELQKMIKSKFFARATIDTVSNEIVIDGIKPKPQQIQTELEEYVCPGCEATGYKPKGSTSDCDYCGSPV